MRLRATTIACHQGAIVTRCFHGRSRNDRKHVHRVDVLPLEEGGDDVSVRFYLRTGNPMLHLGTALAPRRTLFRSRYSVMKYLGYAVGAVLVLSALMRVGPRNHGSEMANAEAMRSLAENTALAGSGSTPDGPPGQLQRAIGAAFSDDLALEPFPDSVAEICRIAPNTPGQADRYTCASDVPPPALFIFHPSPEDYGEDP